MGAMLVHVSALEYLSVLALRRFSEEDLRRIQKAEDFATEKLQGILRRDGAAVNIARFIYTAFQNSL
jgi:hypothetical protein